MPSTLITGASRGIGLATAQLFASQGHRVGLIGRDRKTIDAAAANIPGAVPLVCDVSVETQVQQAFAQFGAPDVLINNAAIIRMNDFINTPDEDWQAQWQTNVMGMVYGCRAAFAVMKKSGGSIVNISSLAGIQGLEKFQGMGAYSVSKHAVVGLTEVLANEGKAYNIRVNCVAPGATDTEMLRQAAPGLKAGAHPEDVARVIYEVAMSGETGEIVQLANA